MLFPASAGPALAFAAAGEAGARVIWSDMSGRLLAVDLAEGSASRLYRAGAVAVTRSPALAGCLAWARAAGPRA